MHTFKHQTKTDHLTICIHFRSLPKQKWVNGSRFMSGHILKYFRKDYLAVVL